MLKLEYKKTTSVLDLDFYTDTTRHKPPEHTPADQTIMATMAPKWRCLPCYVWNSVREDRACRDPVFFQEQCCGWSGYKRLYQFNVQSMSVCRTSTNWASVGSSRSFGSLPVNRGPAGSRAADITKVQLITTLSIEQHCGALYSLLIWLYSRSLQSWYWSGSAD